MDESQKPVSGQRTTASCLIGLSLILAELALAGPSIAPGDLVLRHDIQRLADHGIITGPVSTWPLAWGPILEDIRKVESLDLPPAVLGALARVRERAGWETRVGEIMFNAKAGAADKPTRIRSFQNTPRGDVEMSAGLSWTGEWLTVDLNVQGVDSSQDNNEVRADDSALGAVIGNWSIAASTMQRWWGPGWDGSLILSNNARPVPSVTVDRVFTDPFETKWLSWLGPWDVSVIFGQLESERRIPDARLFGIRFDFRPTPSLEIGLSRTAQWCGDGRPCGLDTFVDLLLGRDNIGRNNIGQQNEPGNQLAGIDVRWAPRFMNLPIAFYGQLIGEDEAGGVPSRFIGQGGVELTGYALNRWSYRAFAEAADTTAEFYAASDRFNYAYNHGIYKTGYRFRGRTIGHGAENDSRLISAGLIMVDDGDRQWRALLRFGELNTGGAPDARNTLTATQQDIASIDVSHSRPFEYGVIDIGAGYERIEDIATGTDVGESRFYLQWRSSY